MKKKKKEVVEQKEELKFTFWVNLKADYNGTPKVLVIAEPESYEYPPIPDTGNTPVDIDIDPNEYTHIRVRIVDYANGTQEPVSLENIHGIKFVSRNDKHYSYSLLKNNDEWQVHWVSTFSKDGKILANEETNVTISDNGSGG